jgi:hypothetical protein
LIRLNQGDLEAPGGEPGAGWPLLAAGLALAALVAWRLPHEAIDWQPALAWTQPWRWWSAAAVHYSALHLGANLLGCVFVAALGWLAPCRRADTWAWWVAIALTHLGLLAQAGLVHYGGLSGALHAGVAIVGLRIVRDGSGVRRWIGAGLLAGVALKVAVEAPWTGPPARAVAGWDLLIAPSAHMSGAIAGALCAGALMLIESARSSK